MNTDSQLFLHEEILLLALHDEKGTSSSGGFFTSAMGGAILSELLLRKVIAISEDKHKKVQLRGNAITGNAEIDECIEMIKNEKNEKKATHWVSKFSGLKDLKNRTARSLVAKGILKEDQDKVLGLFKRTIFPEADHGPEEELRQRLHQAIFTDSEECEGRTIVVVALSNAAQMLNSVFEKKELKHRQERIKKLCNGELVSEATKEAVEAIQMAVMLTAIIIPVMVIPTAT